MREAGRLAPLVPYGADETVYVVEDRVVGPDGISRDVELERSGLEIIIEEMLSAQFNDPVRVVAFNTLEHWAADLSMEVAAEIRMRCDIDGEPVPDYIMDFVERHTASMRSRGMQPA